MVLCVLEVPYIGLFNVYFLGLFIGSSSSSCVVEYHIEQFSILHLTESDMSNGGLLRHRCVVGF